MNGNWNSIDSNVADKIKSWVKEFHYLRGSYLNSYSAAEFLLLDIISKVRPLIQYKSIVTSFPFSTSRRVKLIRRVLETEGPLIQYSESLKQLVNLLEDNDDIRHFLAHGFSKVTYTESGKLGLKLRRYDPKRGELAWEPVYLKFTDDGFRFAVNEIKNTFEIILTDTQSMYFDLQFEEYQL